LTFAGLAAGLSVDTLTFFDRLLIAPKQAATEVPTYSLATLLDCLVSPAASSQVQTAVEGRLVVIGTAVRGEDEHRGPTRFFDRSLASHRESSCAP
jgi:hypothetical protein